MLSIEEQQAQLTQIQRWVDASIAHHIDLASRAFDTTFETPSLTYRLRGKTAGKADFHQWLLYLNPVLMLENQKTFIDEVVPHEIAHLIAFKVYGPQIRPHGIEWKHVMEQVFHREASRTHTFNVESVKGAEFPYRCSCQEHKLSIRRHNKCMRGQMEYHCRYCQQVLVPVE